MTKTHKLTIGVLSGILFFVCSMINTRPPEKYGTCVINETTIKPISNLDCNGVFYE